MEVVQGVVEVAAVTTGDQQVRREAKVLKGPLTDRTALSPRSGCLLSSWPDS